MSAGKPTLIAADLEGVFTPEIWIAVAEKTGIEKLRLTTRDISDYDELMRMRIDILRRHNLRLADIQAVIATISPLPGAVDFAQWMRERTQFVVVSDTFYEFAAPLMAQMNYPTIFCHSLEIDAHGMIAGYRLRLPHPKRSTLHAFRELGFRTLAIGDSYNDTAMLAAADIGLLFDPPANVVADFPDFPVVRGYAEARDFIQTRFLSAPTTKADEAP